MDKHFSRVTTGIWSSQDVLNGVGILNLNPIIIKEIQEIFQNLYINNTVNLEHYRELCNFLGYIETQILHNERFCLIKTLPDIEKFPTFVFENFLLLLIKFLGYPLSQSKKGELICEVRDHNVDYSDPNSRGHMSSQEILPHTDTGDAFCLLCIRQAEEGGTTYIINTRKIFNTILEQKEEYMSFLFTGYPNYRKVEDIHIDEKYYNFPIYLYHKNELSCSFNSRLIKEGIKSSGKKISSLQADALMYFEGLLHNDDLRVPIKLQPGEIIICNNYDIIHYRDSFKDSSTQERLLLRGWFNLHNQRELPEYFSNITRLGIPLETLQ